MKTIEIKDIRNSIVEAIKVSAQKFIKQKKQMGQSIIISENGVLKIIKPEDIR